MDDELAAFDAELKALESSAAAPAPAGPRAPKVISAAPVRSAPPQPPTITGAGGAKLPPSQWASIEQITSAMRSEGLPIPSTAVPEVEKPKAPEAFISSETFSGARPGYIFKAGAKGLGYYLDAPAPEPNAYYSLASTAMTSAAPAAAVASAASSSTGAPSGSSGKATERNITRTVAGQTWKDPTLEEWPEDDFRVFIGDLGNEVNDDVLSHAFQKYPSFQKSRVVRDGRSGKSKGYGFVSFKDPWDMTKALREMQGKYVGNRPIKVRKSTVQERMVTEAHQPLQFNHALGVVDKSLKRRLEKGGAMHSTPKWVEKKKKKHMPW